MNRTKVGIIGCGNICGTYLATMCNVIDSLEVVACADLDMARAEEAAAGYEGVRAVPVDDLFADPEIEVIVNLTVPKAHAELGLRAVAAGKSVHGEKPLALTREEGRALLDAANKAGVLVGSAPDTFMGSGHQSCRKVIDDGMIGEPVAAVAFMMCHGHESWHPDPEFFYQVGGGPMFDMGPYYLTSLINMLGPVRSVTGSARISFPTRTITSEKKKGEVIEVEVPTHVAGLLDFESGVVGTIITSYDVWSSGLPWIEVYGSEGSMAVPDPNSFGGVPGLRIGDSGEVIEVRPEGDFAFAQNDRGIGVADLAAAKRSGRPHRASGEIAYHVLDIMHAFHEASDKGTHIDIKSTCPRPAAMPTGMAQGEIDE